MRVQATCPGCQERTVNFTTTPLEIPYFGPVTQLQFECTNCGFRHSDFQVGTTRDPTRYVYEVRTEDDMMVRVVRSTSGTIRIPELGALIEPGPASDAYVSNIEGVLARIEGVLEQLRRDADSHEQREACKERLEDLRSAKVGKYPLTFIMEDPYGNSVIAHDRARKEALTEEEATHLKTGEITLDLQPPDESHGSAKGNGHRSR